MLSRRRGRLLRNWAIKDESFMVIKLQILGSSLYPNVWLPIFERSQTVNPALDCLRLCDLDPKYVHFFGVRQKPVQSVRATLQLSSQPHGSNLPRSKSIASSLIYSACSGIASVRLRVRAFITSLTQVT